MGAAEDPFFADLRVFDLLYGGDLTEVGQDTLRGHQRQHHARCSCPSRRSLAEDDSARNPVIGIWSDHRAVLDEARAGYVHPDGRPVQVSRLGNPLVNEVVVPAGLKDAFNGPDPDKDATIHEVVDRVTDPELPTLHRGDLRHPGAGGPAQRPGRDLPDRHREEAPTLDGSPADLNSQVDLNSHVRTRTRTGSARRRCCG